MSKFYVMDHGCYRASDWTENSVEIDARSEEHAAEKHAAETDESSSDDGQRFEVVVATQADGSDARLYTGRCIIDVRYKVMGSSKPYKVELPEPDADADGDGEAEAQP